MKEHKDSLFTNPMFLMAAIFTLLAGYLIATNIYDLVRAQQSKGIPIEEVSCKSIENTGRFGYAEYYIFDLDGKRHKVLQEDWDRFDVPICK